MYPLPSCINCIHGYPVVLCVIYWCLWSDFTIYLMFFNEQDCWWNKTLGFLKAWDQQASIGHLYHQSDHMVVLSPSSSTRRMLQLSAPAVVLKCDIPFFVISYDILLLSNFKASCSFSIIPWCAMKWKVYPTYLLPSKVLRSWFEIIVSYRLLCLFFFSSLS